MVDHVIPVVVNHPTIVYLAGDLANDGRRLLGLDVDEGNMPQRKIINDLFAYFI
jgi:hypothetical protein